MVVGLPRPDVVPIPSDHPVVPHGATKGPTRSSFRNDRFGETNLRLRARSEGRLSHLCNLRRVYPAPAICRGRTPTGSAGKRFCRVGPDRLDHGVKAQETMTSATKRTGRSGGLKPPGNDPRNRWAPRTSRALHCKFGRQSHCQFGRQSCEESREAHLPCRSLTISLIVMSIAPGERASFGADGGT